MLPSAAQPSGGTAPAWPSSARGYMRPVSWSEQERPAAVTMWSRTSILSSLPAPTSRAVTASSSALGVGSPLGWLWVTMIAATCALIEPWSTERNTSECTNVPQSGGVSDGLRRQKFPGQWVTRTRIDHSEPICCPVTARGAHRTTVSASLHRATRPETAGSSHPDRPDDPRHTARQISGCDRPARWHNQPTITDIVGWTTRRCAPAHGSRRG